jgi:formate hydrogenlyase subunit 3/multisubunit Na+/H+ antiporter MnhD subunit
VKTLLDVVVSFLASLITFVVAFVVIVAVQTRIHGSEAFEHDAGANFAVAALGCLIGIPAAIVVFIAVLFFLRMQRAPTTPPGRLIVR